MSSKVNLKTEILKPLHYWNQNWTEWL